jgi:hypothetical protein
MSEIILGGIIALVALLFQFYTSHRQMKLIDRCTDKILSYASPSAFATYATSTPTAKDDASHSFRDPYEVVAVGSNGKSSSQVPPGYNGDYPLPDHLEFT